MHIVIARNVNDAFYSGCNLMLRQGKVRPSRNGPVLRVPGIVATEYSHPAERVLFDPRRNANPFFHLFEALWMLNGGNDVETLDEILPSFKQFSDDKVTYHGAYGHRWRNWPIPSSMRAGATMGHIDQLDQVIGMLGLNKSDRRAVIAMWDPERDLAAQSNDIPCNDLINLEVDDGKLNMLVTCRSNDIIYGCYGANAVHFSMLFEYLAAHIGVQLGTYTQVSFNFHAYLQTPYNFYDVYPPYQYCANPYEVQDERPIRAHPLVTDRDVFDRELMEIMRLVRERALHVAHIDHISNAFFHHVVQPMYQAFRLYKNGDLPGAISRIQEALSLHAHDIDWLYAADNWLQRILDKREGKATPVDADTPVDPNPDAANAPKENAPRDSLTQRYQSWRDKPHAFVEQKGTSGCATCGYGPGAIFHNSFEVAQAKRE